MGVLLLGTGFVFQAPVASASIPEIVGKEQLLSAIALGGIQMNLAGIIGPALGGVLIPLVGVSTIFTLNAAAFGLVLDGGDNLETILFDRAVAKRCTCAPHPFG